MRLRANAVLLIWKHMQTAELFHCWDSQKRCIIVMSLAQMEMRGSWKGRAESHSASTYRQCSPTTDTGTALNIHTSSRQQEKKNKKKLFVLAVNLLFTFHITARLFSLSLTFSELIHFPPHRRQSISFFRPDIEDVFYAEVGN